MGPLRLPTTGLIYLDSAPVIYGIENHSVYAPLLVPLWVAVRAGEATVVTSELTILEGLVGAMRLGDPVLANHYRAIREDTGIRVVPIDSRTIERAAELRAQRPALRTPDAIHVATADLALATAFVTNDEALRSAPLPSVIVVDDLIP